MDLSSNYFSSSSYHEKPKIPKIIMQTWKNKDVPYQWKPSPQSIEELMPDWRYVLMTDEDNDRFVKRYFPDFWEVYDDLEYPIMKADAIRYMWLYINGGIYMDLDIAVTKPLDKLFGERADLYLVKSGNVGSVYTNSFMASKPRCRFWLKCLDEIKKNYKWWAFGKHFKVMTKTGPLMLSEVLENHKYEYYVSEIPRKLVMPCSMCDTKPCTKPGAYTMALEGSSWCGWDSVVYGTCVCHWGKIIVGVGLIIIILLLLWFYLVPNGSSNEW